MAKDIKKEEDMLKSKRGSITMIAYIAMLFFAMYGVILYSNSVTSYTVQTKAIENIQRAYTEDATLENMQSLYRLYSTPIQ